MSDETNAPNEANNEESVEQEVTATATSQEKTNDNMDDFVTDGSEDQTEIISELDTLNAEQLIAKVKQAQEKADENWDIALRSKAEMDNVRRRTQKDVANAHKFGIEKLASELLPVKDSMELGIKAAIDAKSDDEANAKIIEGMEMTLKALIAAMDKVGIKEIAAAEGDTFNPELHQAMTMQEIEGKESNTIISIFQKGYSLNDRLLRAAMVLVAK